MRKLTLEEIEKLASRKGVRKIAVENFLSTMGQDRTTAQANLWLDVALYRWNNKTVDAILDGIALACTENDTLPL